MQILQIVALGVMAAVIALVLRASKPELSLQIALAAGVIILIVILSNIAAVIDFIGRLASKYNVNLAYFNIVLKIIGVAYIAELGVHICRDACETAIAAKVEMGCKVIMAAMSLPIVSALIETVAGMLA
ncbi:MAG: stage III sporulation protein AD [Bacillota bacterium]|nr:stage III sporulation protein AD [Bacillota bacterium]